MELCPTYQNLKHLDLAFKEQKIGHREISVTTQILDRVNIECVAHINNNMTKFMQALLLKSKSHELSWEDQLKTYDWLFEWDRIKNFVDNDNSIYEEKRREI